MFMSKSSKLIDTKFETFSLLMNHVMLGIGKPPIEEQFKSRVSPSWYLKSL